MNKSAFKQIRKKCPWYYTFGGEPKCSATERLPCSKKNCATLYIIQILKAFEKENSDE